MWRTGGLRPSALQRVRLQQISFNRPPRSQGTCKSEFNCLIFQNYWRTTAARYFGDEAREAETESSDAWKGVTANSLVEGRFPEGNNPKYNYFLSMESCRKIMRRAMMIIADQCDWRMSFTDTTGSDSSCTTAHSEDLAPHSVQDQVQQLSSVSRVFSSRSTESFTPEENNVDKVQTTASQWNNSRHKKASVMTESTWWRRLFAREVYSARNKKTSLIHGALRGCNV